MNSLLRDSFSIKLATFTMQRPDYEQFFMWHDSIVVTFVSLSSC